MGTVKILLLMALMSLSVSGFGDVTPSTEAVVPKAAYVMTRPDSAHEARIFAEGIYPSTCYRNGPDHVKVSVAERLITIESTAFISSNGPCDIGFIGYSKVISLGKLPAGTYAVTFQGSRHITHQMGILVVSPSKDPEKLP